MALYAIGDLHLCLGAPKPMDVFGGAWVGYMEKLRRGMSIITPEDTTVLMGDLSWALDLQFYHVRISVNPLAKKSFSRGTMIIGGALLPNFRNSARKTALKI